MHCLLNNKNVPYVALLLFGGVDSVDQIFQKPHHTKNRHLYDLESDQFENENIIQTLPEITKELEENLDHIKSSSTKESEDISEEETKKIQDELKRLGYM